MRRLCTPGLVAGKTGTAAKPIMSASGLDKGVLSQIWYGAVLGGQCRASITDLTPLTPSMHQCTHAGG